MRLRPWAAYLVISGAIIVVSRFVSSDNLQLGALAVVQLSGGAAVFAGVRWHRPEYGAAWIFFGASAVLFSVGVGCWLVYSALIREPFPFPGWPDALFLPAYTAVAVGLMVVVRLRSPGFQVQAFLDALLLTVSLGFMNWVFLTKPALTAGSLTNGQAAITVAYPVIDVITVGLVVHLLLRGSRLRTPAALWLVAAGVVANLSGDVAYGVHARLGSYTTGSLPDQLWMLSMVLLGTAALHPSMKSVAVSADTEREVLGHLRLVVVLLSLQVYPVIVGVAFIRGDAISTGEFAALTGILGPLVGLRIYTAMQGLRRITLSDSLTGLVGRDELLVRLGRSARRAMRDPGRSALLYVDVDNFKLVNDTLGHHVGDQLLQAVGARMLGLSRRRDTVARMGGDEFAILYDGVDGGDLETLADRLVSSLAQPMLVQGRDVYLGASVGVVVLDGDDAATVLRNADAATYTAKAAGRSRWVRFSHGMVDHLAQQMALDDDARHALSRGELRLVYQPVVALDDLHVVGAEALLRWRHPVRGEVPPLGFIPSLERTGQMEQVGAWVRATALRTAATWRDVHGGQRLRLAVNVSPVELVAPGFVSQISHELAATRTPPQDLCIEVVETAAVREEDDDALHRNLDAVAALGCRVALDDFGIGYSTITQVARLPVSIIKIDRSFLHLKGPDNRRDRVVRALVGMGRTLGLTVVAEGIETWEQASFLHQVGCAEAQGFLFGRPTEVEDVSPTGEFGPRTHGRLEPPWPVAAGSDPAALLG